MINGCLEKRKGDVSDVAETARVERFTSGNGGFSAPIVVSNGPSIKSPTTHPHPNRKMSETVSNNSEASSIFGAEQDGRCIALREKWQHITTLYAKFAVLHAKYGQYSSQEIQDSDDIFENCSDIDLERGQICLAIRDLASEAMRVFEPEEDRQKLAHVARNCERKRKQMERCPFLLEADADTVRSCHIPHLSEICPGLKLGSKLNLFGMEVAGPDGANCPLPLTPTLRNPYANLDGDLMPYLYPLNGNPYGTPNLRLKDAVVDADVGKDPNTDNFASPYVKSNKVGQGRKGNQSHGGIDDESAQGRAIQKSSKKTHKSIGKQRTGQTGQQRSEELSQRNGQLQWHGNSQQMQQQQQQQQLQVDLEQQLDQQKQTCMSLRQQCGELMDNAVKQQQQAKQQMDQMTAAHDKINRQAHQQAQQQRQLQIDLEQQ